MSEKTANRENLTQEVYDVLLHKLMTNQMVPGHILNRKEISEELGVSMAPVREALIRLTYEGFVETFPRRGTVVKAINRDDLFGALILREAIEAQAARMYFGKRMEKNLPELRESAALVDRGDEDEVKRLGLEVDFHLKLVELSNCAKLVDEFKKQMNVNVFHSVNLFLANSEKQERMKHLDLVEKLYIAKSPEEADRIIRDHLHSGKRSFLQSGE